MPYWGASVRNNDYLVQAKVHGEEFKQPAPDDLIEYVLNLAKTADVVEGCLAKFFAEKIAKALVDLSDALWVTVDIIMSDGRLFGYTEVIKENAE